MQVGLIFVFNTSDLDQVSSYPCSNTETCNRQQISWRNGKCM